MRKSARTDLRGGRSAMVVPTATVIPSGYADRYREVLVLYRKRERARRRHKHGVFARFRYNDLKEAARGCGGRGPYANSMVG
jgi:hypothetical protein